MRALRVGVAVFAIAGAVSVASVGQAAGQKCPWMAVSKSPRTRAHELLAAMTLGDKIQMVTGQYSGPNAASGSSNPIGAASYIEANPKLCIPALSPTDNINGVGDQMTGTTAFPDSIALTATWDPALTQHYGQTLGEEAFKKGVNVLLGPGMDIARTPLNGRNFEYAGEDPYLAGRAVAAVIRGLQSEHVVATAKHYALNDQETNRNTDSSDASVRTMQEIDLPAFDASVKAGVGAVMCSYNRIHSVYACENPYTQRHVLDHQFGFSGWVMSDWGATHSTVPSAKAGLDMEMPSGTYYGNTLKTAIQKRQVSMATLNEMVYRVIFTMFRLGLFNHVPAEGSQAAAAVATTPDSLSMATSVAEAGTVLLKNRHRILPLTGSGRRIAVIGPAAGQHGAELCYQGGGSGHNPEFGYMPDVVSPLTAIQTRAAESSDTVTYADGSSMGDAVAAASAADVAVVFICDGETEGSDRPNMNADFGACFLVCGYSPIDQNALVSAVAAANPNTIVVIQAGGPVAMPWIGHVKGVLDNWYPGQTDGLSIAPILFGDVDPSGHLPDTFPVKLSDGPLRTKAQYPGVTKKGDSVGPHSIYSEGLLVGYRWYEAKRIRPLFPFGYGLSYTRFRFSKLTVRQATRGAWVSFRLTDTGGQPGADVAQVYVGDPASTGEPPRQLKGFRKVGLNPGHSARVRIWLPEVAFAHWATRAHTWAVSAGRYRIYVGDSSATLRLKTSIHRGAATLRPGAY
jgi:beta-glucosidase